MSTNYKTEQETFWAGDFGDAYVERNTAERLLASKIALWTKMLKCAHGVDSAMEFGCNVGLNLHVLLKLNPQMRLRGMEINMKAAAEAAKLQNVDIVTGSILTPMPKKDRFDLTFTAGVLIHINPDQLSAVYENLVQVSNRYVLIAEYFNPRPVAITYRGNEDRLFKRDFAGELIDQYNLKLVDYGFVYKRDNWSPQDNITWFLLEK